MARGQKFVTIKISGPAATGKSLLAGALASFLRANGHSVRTDETAVFAPSFEQAMKGRRDVVFHITTTNEGA